MTQTASGRLRAQAEKSRAFESPINFLLALNLDWASESSPKIAGLSRADADEIYQLATKTHALPAKYAPKDTVKATQGGIPAYATIYVRQIIVPDARAMVKAASSAGIHLQVISGYRSYSVQQLVFAKWTRENGSAQAASLYSARPGHSQHQLGIALDFNSFGKSFADTPTGRWLWDNAHLFGFVFPYTEMSSPRTGYAYEPWHVRWVGRELAAIMERAGYRESATFMADDFVAAVREVARLSGATMVFRRELAPSSGYPAFRLSGPRVH